VTNFQALLAPLLVDSYDLQEKVFDEGIPQRMLDGVEVADLVGIGVLPGPMRKVLGISKPLLTPADFAGQVVGLQDSALGDATLRALGATPRPVPSSAQLDGLDGYEQQFSSIAGNGYQTTAEAVTSNVNLWPRPLVIVAGRKAFAALTSAQQDALRDATAAAVPDALEASRAEDAATIPGLCQPGFTLATASDADLDALRAALEPVYAELEADPTTAGYLTAITDLKREVAAPAEAPTCDAATTGAGEFPQGTFEMVMTRNEAKNGGVGEEAEHDQTFFEMVIDDGAINIFERYGSRSAPRVPGWTGTYEVYRDHIKLPGKPSSARWTFDGTNLTFTEIVGEPGDVTVWGLHPWVLKE
jgi:hypothetical protein